MTTLWQTMKRGLNAGVFAAAWLVPVALVVALLYVGFGDYLTVRQRSVRSEQFIEANAAVWEFVGQAYRTQLEQAKRQQQQVVPAPVPSK